MGGGCGAVAAASVAVLTMAVAVDVDSAVAVDVDAAEGTVNTTARQPRSRFPSSGDGVIVESGVKMTVALALAHTIVSAGASNICT